MPIRSVPCLPDANWRLKTRAWSEVIPALRNMVAAAKMLRESR
jgi:methionine synthase II (cobalamin-independent)